MWPVIGLIAAAAAIAAIETPAMVRSKSGKDLAAFIVLLAFALTVSILHSLRLPVPNPLHLIIGLFKPIGSWLS